MTPMTGETKMTPMSHDSELTKWFLEKHGGTKKGKPHSTREGRIAAGERALWRGVEEQEKRKKRKPGPGAPSRPRPKAGPSPGRPKAPGGRQGLPRLPKKKPEEGMYVQKGGVVDQEKRNKAWKRFTESSIDKKNRRRNYKKGERLNYKKGGVILPKKRPKDKKLVEPFSDPVTKPIHKVLKHLKETIYEGKHYDFRHLRDPKIEAERGKSRAGKKKGGKVDKKWIQKAVDPKHKGYCTPMTKKTCTPARKALARTFKKKAKTGWG